MITLSDEQVTRRIGSLKDLALERIERHEARSEIEPLFKLAYGLTGQIQDPTNRRVVRLLLGYYEDENLRNYHF